MEPMTELESETLRRYYRHFAEVEAAGTSPLYAEWAAGVADDDEIVDLLLPLPRPKRQANLLFAAARHLGAGESDFARLRAWLLTHWEAVRSLMLERSTQTNEAGRCAVLLPVLSQVSGPIALIEVGASAGLCLYPDRYTYEYRSAEGVVRLDPDDGPSTVVLECELTAAQPPSRLPEVVWRAGIDLNPLDVTDPGERAWLRSLIWPEHEVRRARLDAAAVIAAADPPRLVAGDLTEAVDSLLAEVPAGAQVVLFHSAVLAYVDAPGREQFTSLMRSRDDIMWVSNEGERVLPDVGEQLRDFDIESAGGRFVLAVDGVATALTGPHGQSYQGLTPRTPV